MQIPPIQIQTKQINGIKSLFPLIALVAVTIIQNAYSQNGAAVIWDGSESTAWTTGGNWDTGNVPANTIAFGTGNRARFTGTPPANQPNVNSNRAIYGLQFWASGYTLGGGTNTLTVGGGGIEVATNVSALINTNLTGGAQSYAIQAGAVLTTSNSVTNTATLTKSGDGRWDISGGSVTATSGGLSIQAGALRFVNGGNRISSNTNLTLGNAELQLNNFSNTTGSLLLSGDGSISFGTASGANSLSFANSSALDWSTFTLTISGFEAGLDTLRFGSDATGLTVAQLSRITFDGYSAGAQIDSLGYVTAIPEPGAISLAVVGLTMMTIFLRRRDRSKKELL